jgi:uncharacterized protein YbjQ (UPF0145 family)
MSTENDDQNDGEWDDPSDLTRLEDLSEFLHEEDPDVEAKLKAAKDDIDDSPPALPGEEDEDLLGLEDLESDSEQTYQEDPEDLNNFSSEDETNPNLNLSDALESNVEDSSVEDSNDEDSTEFTSAEFTTEDQLTEDEEGLSFGSDEETFGETNDFLNNEGESTENLLEDDSEDLSLNSTIEEETNWDEDDLEGEDNSLISSEEENNIEDEENQFSAMPENESEPESEEEPFEEHASKFTLPDPQELEERPPISIGTPENNSTPHIPRENFQDLRDFGNAITYGVVTTGGNPPFSLILRQIKYEEDAEDIKIVLREHGLVSDDNEETIDQGLEQGSLLISQISEYSAIYLAHKLRRFDVEMRIGLSDQLHPSKSYSSEGKGLVSKYNLKQNKSEHLNTINAEIDIEDIKITTTPTVDGYNIHRYIEVITSHSLVEEDELKRLHDITKSSAPVEEDEVLLGGILDQFPKEEKGSLVDQFDLGLNEVYRELVIELRNEAFKIEANAVVGVNFNITPLMFRTGNSSSVQYKITCSGNAVWVVDHQ